MATKHNSGSFSIPRALPARARNDEESQHRQCRNRQQREPHEHPHVQFPIHALPCPGGMKDVGELQREKEERLIVGHGSNVERVSRRVNGCIASCNQSKKFLAPRATTSRLFGLLEAGWTVVTAD